MLKLEIVDVDDKPHKYIDGIMPYRWGVEITIKHHRNNQVFILKENEGFLKKQDAIKYIKQTKEKLIMKKLLKIYTGITNDNDRKAIIEMVISFFDEFLKDCKAKTSKTDSRFTLRESLDRIDD